MTSLNNVCVMPMLGPFPRLLVAGLLTLLVTLVSTAETFALQASPASLTFQAVQGGVNPSNQVVTLSKKLSRQVGWKSVDTANWLSASPASGTITSSAQLVVSVNISGLSAGTYTGSVTVTLSKGGSLSIPVTLTVTSAGSSGSGTASATATLSWLPNTDTDLAGYKVYMGTSSGLYGNPVNVGNVTSYVAGNLKAGTTYYFSVTAYDQSGNESVYSGEVSKSIY